MPQDFDPDYDAGLESRTSILTVYITIYGEGAIAILADKDRWPPAMGYLNYYLGMFKLPGSDLRWQVVYLLSPLARGENNLREILQVQGGQDFHLDGLQSFILFR